MKLEPMAEFFDSRLDMYDRHQLECIGHAEEFYQYTASVLPDTPGCRILDLGCGTGLELDRYFPRNPTARVTGIDLAPGMLDALAKKHRDKALTLINASYFTEPFGENAYDAAVSVESLHHFTAEQKIPLYAKLRAALRDGGCFILTDYFAEDDSVEAENFRTRERLIKEQEADGAVMWHFDTPLTLKHETEALIAAGFSGVKVLREWGHTATVFCQVL